MKKFNSVLYIFSNMDSSSQILLFLIILVALMLVSIVVINYFTKKKNNNSLKNVTNKKISILKEKINESNNDIKPLVDLKKSDKIEVEETKIEKINTIEPKKENIEVMKDNSQEVVEVISKKTSLDDITKLIEDTLEPGPINLTKFEEDQEEYAIISYDELVKRAGAKKIIYKCEEDNILDKINNKDIDSDDEVKQDAKPSTKKFQASKIISPVFGVQKEKEETDEVLETFIDLEEFSFDNTKSTKIETQNDMEFLTSLKEFRSGLD